MSLLERLTRYNEKLERRIDKQKNLERHAAELQAKAEYVEDLMSNNAIMAVPPEHLEDFIRVMRRGLTATNDVHPVVVTMIVRWTRSQEEQFLQGEQR